MNRPVDAFLASFVGMETVISGQVVSAKDGMVTVRTAGREVKAVSEVAAGEEVLLCVRPENVILATQDLPGSSARNVIPARVARLKPRGLFYSVELDCGFPLVASISRSALDDLSLRTGQPVTAIFKATAVHVIRTRKRH